MFLVAWMPLLIASGTGSDVHLEDKENMEDPRIPEFLGHATTVSLVELVTPRNGLSQAKSIAPGDRDQISPKSGSLNEYSVLSVVAWAPRLQSQDIADLSWGKQAKTHLYLFVCPGNIDKIVLFLFILLFHAQW